ncbi:MAG: VWA domain-containing protein [Gemmatimonadaceae bacterium]|nr:VWA domain-containing protein [Gemmatimonadaceae bacterium]MDQ3243531.1 VWA domain-containing protein [Gemmatimonadota bacterium]
MALGSLEIQSPWALVLLLLLPLWWVWRRRRSEDAIVFSRTGVLARGPRAGQGIARAIFILRNVTLAGVILALARPRTGARVENITTSGINIVLSLDLSSSMLAQDFQPNNRLEVAKARAMQFVRARSSDRIGVVAFAGEALTQVPLTTDHAVVLQAIDNLQAGQLEDGTAIGLGIATAANRLRDAAGRSRVMIVVTDGVNNRGQIDPLSAAKAAAVYGIRIYGIGVGSEGYAPVPVGRDVFGLRFENQPVKIDEVVLRNIAALTGGKYFRARDAAALGQIYSQIDRLERVPVQSRSYVRFTELYRWALGLALLALLLELALTAWKAPLP